MNQKPKRRILVAPLDWGLGHATRCVPLIRDFLKADNEVILTANGRAESFLKQEFPELEFAVSPGYNVRYSKYFPLWLMLLFQSPGILFKIYLEHKWLNRFIRENRIDEVVSDNRYGLWSKNIRSIFITHQVMIKCPGEIKFLENFLHGIVLRFIHKFDECWIPDRAEQENLSGDLSHKYPIPDNAKFIGWLSRYSHSDSVIRNDKPQNKNDYEYAMCIILSGPEPSRTELENIVRKSSVKFNRKVLMIQGKPEQNKTELVGEHLKIISHLGQKDLEYAIHNSELIICRAGYSSIMDLKVLGKNAVLIPTPGQTEQEYLGRHLSDSENFKTVQQKNFAKEYLLRDNQETNDDGNVTVPVQNPVSEYSG